MGAEHLVVLRAYDELADALAALVFGDETA